MHYVSIPNKHIKAAKQIAEARGQATTTYCAGPLAWFLRVDEATAHVLLICIPGASSKTVKRAAPIESTPDAENILTPQKVAR